MSYQKKEVKSRFFTDFERELPSMKGHTVVITGTTSGTGNVAARVAAKLGAKVLLLNRKSDRSTRSFTDLKQSYPQAEIIAIDCDLQSFDSVRRAAQEIKRLCPEGVHVLANNAGVMALKDEATADGFDVQMQTNHLSHFLLTKELMPLLDKAAQSSGEARVVNHSSIARMNPKKNLLPEYLEKKGGKLGGDGANILFGGARWVRYGQTKLANAAFTAALHQKLQASGSKVKSLLAHPGLSNTGLQVTTVQDGGMGNFFTNMFMNLGQSQEDGAMGLISCMLKPDVKSGEFFGPGSGPYALKGKAISMKLESFYDNEPTRNLLWQKSCEAIGEDFKI